MVSEDKPKYTISDFTEAGIHQFVQDISSPLQDEWDKNAKKTAAVVAQGKLK